MIELTTWYVLPLIFVAGFSAGIVNTLAGSGSVFTLSTFIFLGLPANVANGTNRVAVLLQSAVATYTFKRGGELPYQGQMGKVIPAIIGALLGAWWVAGISAETFERIVGGVMVVMLVIVVADPAKRVKKRYGGRHLPALPLWAELPLFLLIGLYGGFIQVGIGILLIISFSLTGIPSLVKANGLKLLVITCYTLPVLVIFVLNDQVAWAYGLLMSGGQIAGSLAASRFAIKSPHAEKWIKRLLVVIIIFTIAKTFGWLGWLMENIAYDR